MADVSFMKAPGPETTFEVGDTVEVYCDHEKSSLRTRGWLKGIVVQVDYKMVAVQFRTNVYFNRWLDGSRSYSLVPFEFPAYSVSAS